MSRAGDQDRLEVHIKRKSYRKASGGELQVLGDASLTIASGEVAALIGPSGCGKTTTMRIVNRLIEPDQGRIVVADEDVTRSDPVELRRRIGYVIQQVGLFPHMTIAENIGITPQLLGWSRPDIDSRVAELLDLVELPQDYAGRLPHALSGGQRQRAGVARAIAARPRVVLMDEPFGALDPIPRDALGTAYRAIHDRLGVTTIMVTHDVQEAVLLADRIAVMGGGRILAEGDYATVSKNSEVVGAYMGTGHA